MKRLITFISVVLILGAGIAILIIKVPKGEAQGSYDQIDAYGTINSAGIRIRPIPANVTSATLQYRKQGTSQWKQGLDPVITVANQTLETSLNEGVSETLNSVRTSMGAMIRRAHGSVMYLDPDSTYELRVELKDSGGAVVDTITKSVTTWADQYPFGQSSGNTLNVPGSYSTIQAAVDAASPGDIVSVASGTRYDRITFDSGNSGTDQAPITVRGNGTILTDNPSAPSSNPHVQFNTGAHDIIIEGFEFLGLRGYNSTSKNKQMYLLGSNLQRLVIRNNTFNSPQNVTASSWMLMAGGNGYISPSEVLIEDNTFTAANLTTGSLGAGIFFEGGKGVVVRRNTINIGDAEDVVSFRGGPKQDWDIYDNEIHGTGFDDGMELEGCVNINMRVWGNLIDDANGSKATVSHTPIVVGPVYVFRNVFYGSLQSYKVASNMVINFPFSTDDLADLGPVFYYHNTFYHPFTAAIGTDTPQIFRYTNRLCHSNTIWKNNIFYNRYPRSEMGQATTYNREDPNNEYSSRWGQVDHDYNLYHYSGVTTNPNASYNIDMHSLFTNPLFVASTWPNLDLNLQSTSPAVDYGIPLPNINDNYYGSAPDLGAFELGESSMTVYKSVDKTSASSGDVLTYTINCQNVSGGSLTSVLVEDPIPAGSTYVAGSATSGGTFDGSKVIWNQASLAAGANITVSFQVTVN